MTTIELVANDQLLQVTVSPKISSGEVNTVGIHVDFSDEWNNFGKNAVFYTSYNSRDIYEIVMTNDECIVPSEVMKKSGTLYIGIRGVNNTKVKTTSLVKLKISEGAPTGNSTEVEPTPDVYQQLLTAYGKTDNSIKVEKAERQAEIAVERARIDNISTLTEGSTTGDAELLDIRVKADGSTATSAGNAVREQVSELKSDLTNTQNVLENAYTLIGESDVEDYVKTQNVVNGYLNNLVPPSIVSSANQLTTDVFYVGVGTKLQIKVNAGYRIYIKNYDSEKVAHGGSGFYTSNTELITTYPYIALSITKNPYSTSDTISPNEKSNLKVIRKIVVASDNLKDAITTTSESLNAIADVTLPTTMDFLSFNLVEDKYWGNGGLNAVGQGASYRYYAASTLIDVQPNQIIKLKNFGLYSANGALIGMYNSNNGDAPGRVNIPSTYVVSYVVENGLIKEAVIKTSNQCAKVGLFIKIDTTVSDVNNLPYLPTIEIGEASVSFTSEAKQEIIEISSEANYYLKGSAQKLARTKKLCILGAGQSNIDGRVPVNQLPSGITLPMTGMKYIKNSLSGTFENAFPSVTLWGFDLITCYNVIQNLGDNELYYIKWSKGGTAIDPSSTTDDYYWTADYEQLDNISKSLLLSFNKEIAKCAENNPNQYEVGAMLWHQGEGDYHGFSDTAPDNYYFNFKKVIAFCRGIVHNECLPFICGTVSHNSSQYDAKVEAAVLKIAEEDPYVTCIDMSGATLLDSYHFDATSTKYLGEMMYDALIDYGVISGTKINPQRPWN